MRIVGLHSVIGCTLLIWEDLRVRRYEMKETKSTKSPMKCCDISGEKSRIYKILANGADGGCIHEIFIKNPLKLFYYPGGDHAFHRIFDGITMYLAPAPGFIWGSCGRITGYCEVTWEPKDKNNPCAF